MKNHAKEGKTEHLRRHFRRPKVSSRDETRLLSAAEPLLSAAESPIISPSGAPSASESLVQRRNSTFGGTFGGRMCMTDPKVHLPEAAFGSQSHLHKAFGGRKSLRRPNLCFCLFSLFFKTQNPFYLKPLLKPLLATPTSRISTGR